MKLTFKLKTNLISVTALLALAIFAMPARGVIVASTNGNTTAASLTAASGPGNFFNNVGKSSTGNASATYLGNGWMIAARHEAIGSAFGQIQLPIGNFTVVDSSITFLTNPDVGHTPADLQMFRIANPPSAAQLPAIAPAFLGSSTPSGVAMMVGNGVSTTAPHFWDVNKSTPSNWVWNTGVAQGNPSLDQYGGFDINQSHIIRWGANQIINTLYSIDSGDGLNTLGLSTQFDDTAYTHAPPLTVEANEAQATSGDSGGAVFNFSGGNWRLSGIMLGTNMPLNHQPGSTVLYGDVTYFADLSFYRSQIISIMANVPEPSSLALAGSAAVALVIAGLKRRRR